MNFKTNNKSYAGVYADFGADATVKVNLQNRADNATCFTFNTDYTADAGVYLEYKLFFINDFTLADKIPVYTTPSYAGKLVEYSKCIPNDWVPKIPTDGLVAYYPFNGNANDVSGNNNNGTVNGATLTTDRKGNANSAYNFNGVGNEIDGNWNSNLESFSISLWHYTNSFSNTWPCFINIYDNKNSINGFHFNTSTSDNNSYYLALHSANQANQVLFYQNSETNKWKHIVVTYKNGKAKLYIENVLKSEINNIPLNNLTALNIFYIGQEYSGVKNNTYFNGKLDDIRIYNRELSDVEVQALYNE